MNISFLEKDLQKLEHEGLRRFLRQVESAQTREIILNGKRVLNFCSNNYLGLADDQRIRQAAIKAIKDGYTDKEGKVVMKPAEGLSDDDVKALVAYMRTFKK